MTIQWVYYSLCSFRANHADVVCVCMVWNSWFSFYPHLFGNEHSLLYVWLFIDLGFNVLFIFAKMVLYLRLLWLLSLIFTLIQIRIAKIVVNNAFNLIPYVLIVIRIKIKWIFVIRNKINICFWYSCPFRRPYKTLKQY